MAILTVVGCHAIRASATPDAGGGADAPFIPASPSPRLTRVILPKKKPLKWSTGTASGEYVGPPTSTKLRKYWGGGEEDPIASTDDYIWNKEFMGHMKRLIGDEQSSSNPVPYPVMHESSGFLNLDRAMSLDSMEIDLSKELSQPTKRVLEQQVEAAGRGLSAIQNPSVSASPKWPLVPTRREQAKWDRANKAATGGTDVIIHESTRKHGDPMVMEIKSKEEYIKIDKPAGSWFTDRTSLNSNVNHAHPCTWAFTELRVYLSPNCHQGEQLHLPRHLPFLSKAAFCIFVLNVTNWTLKLLFGLGLLGSLLYIRMLGYTVDSMAGGAQGLVKNAVGQPRLLVPVVLVMIYNRWNEKLVPDLGFIHLELIPMLVGFFTYKVATFAQAIQDSFFLVDERNQG
ncbi:hypothetical protein HPP92_009434 [Vanilla planifolia]|uniref:CGL160/ATPI domain-containing protein n=1 Tax=Vanilla planifolia TaxID=51239 RepID=A0A835R4M8_VANPL|nr:hypothetical protein HPP92_009665 [Vanilla planifolia]KAG0487339.1 hypothetical protein HPP92_009434 [Vanilla planifolia]